MLNQYKNIDQIKSATQSVSGERIVRTKSEFASYDLVEPVYLNTDIINVSNDNRIEFHVYSNDTWLTGNHKIQFQTKIPEFKDKATNAIIPINTAIGIDLYSEFEKLKLTAGNFRIAFNFFKNLIGSYERQHLRIDEISPDRTEIRLRAIDDTDPEFLQQITNYIQTVNQTAQQYYKPYLLNFSRNNCVLFVNSVVIGEYLYVKLQEPLSQDIAVDFKCWIVEEQKPTYIDRVAIQPKVNKKQFNSLAGPNWQAFSPQQTSAGTDYRTWTDILGSSVQTSQQIVDAYFSGSLSGVKLNIDYSDFNNFVFYSSATERLENFKYKLQLLEQYTSQSSAVASLSGSVATTNSQEFFDLKTSLVSGFDDFEKFLYYESSSKLTTHTLPLEFVNVSRLTGSYVAPVPKLNATRPYALVSTTSSIFNNWYNGLYDSASFYDVENINSLYYTIPEFIRNDLANVWARWR